MSRVNEQKDEIEKFYKMKNEYETKRQASIRSILANRTLTTAEKRERIAQLKLKCIGCKGDGGTIFKTDALNLRASCGAANNCGWVVEIEKGEPVAEGTAIVSQLSKDITDIKKTLIFHKVSHEVGDGDGDVESVVALFENAKAKLEELTRSLIDYDSKLLEITDNVETANEISLLKVEVYNLVQEYKDLLLKYEDSGKEAFLTDAMNIVQDILPKVTSIRNKKYRVSNVVHDEDGTVRLVQEPYSIEDIEMVVPKSMMMPL
jgi:hypothetical protein